MGDPIHHDDWQLEQQEWLEAMEEIIESEGKQPSAELFQRLRRFLARKGIQTGGVALNTPYCNTIAAEDEPAYPGNIEMEQQIENIMRWNAQAMVLQAYDKHLELGGHIATYSASSTLYEVLFNHFLRARTDDYGGDLLLIQGHASPGIYARAVLEGRLPVQAIHDFRQETLGGVASYPHPRRMQDFWQVPSVSMGLGPLTAVYQARFLKYLEARGLKPQNGGKVYCFVGDGEMDEPEVFGSISLAAREKLDNLVFVLHCNLQRLDGPVRGNGKVIQEAERMFSGASWEVIKVVWSSEWDAILANDIEGMLLSRLEELIDGDYQEMVHLSAADLRAKLVNNNAVINAILSDVSDEQLLALRRGGHDHKKVYAAFHKAQSTDKPTVILAKTVKGWGMGKAGAGKNGAHQTKNLMPDSRVETKNWNKIPLSDKEAQEAKFYLPKQDDPLVKYLQERRQSLGGYLPQRMDKRISMFTLPALTIFDGQLQGSKGKGDKAFSTTAALVDIMTQLIRTPEMGKYVVPIVPDEAQTFGMEPMFNSAQIYNPLGQNYTPLEIKISVIKYKESKTGQVLQEGINEAGATGSFTVAGASYATTGVPTVPFYIFYSMFGFQRVADSIWAAADMLTKGFLLGATAGRTTLNGEGLQHEDGHSQLIALTNPGVTAYDPAFAYEAAIIVHDGIKRMYVDNENHIYYITIYNENYMMPEMPKGVEQGILDGIYKFKKSATKPSSGRKAQLLGSGCIIQQVLGAAEILEGMGISTDIWSVTSWNNLYRDAEACTRYNLLNPGKESKVPLIRQAIKGEEGVFVAASDWMKLTPGSLAKWMPEHFIALGTDGFGLSDSRENLRDYFEISAKYIAFTALRLLQLQGKVAEKEVADFMKIHGIQGDKLDPMAV